MINISLIGKGYWGSKMERYIKEDGHFQLINICDSKSDLDKMVYHNPEINAVIVATPNLTHYELVKAALSNGKHVLCEKPLTLRMEECLELKDLSRAKNCVMMTDFTYTLSRALNLAQKLVQEKRIGEIIGIEMYLRQLGRFGKENVYWLIGSHMLAILDMFIPLETLEFERRDLVIYNGEVETGSLHFKKSSGQITVSLNYPGKDSMVAIYGERGSIIYKPLLQQSLHVENYERLPWTVASELPKKKEVFEIDESNNLKLIMEHFSSAINSAIPDNIDRATKVTKILESIQEEWEPGI